jgi:hypothetical protein
MAFDWREVGRLEELVKVLTGLADPRGGNLAGRADGGHRPLLSAKDSPIPPQLASLVKFRDPSYIYNLASIIDLTVLAAIAAWMVRMGFPETR